MLANVIYCGLQTLKNHTILKTIIIFEIIFQTTLTEECVLAVGIICKWFSLYAIFGIVWGRTTNYSLQCIKVTNINVFSFIIEIYSFAFISMISIFPFTDSCAN